MQALILAGGEGTRLRPLTTTVPKPVVPLVDRPFIAFMLDWLRSHGVEDIVISCGHMASGVRNVLGDGSAFGVKLRYVEEPTPLGTGGALKYAESLLDDRFFMLNGDVLTDIDLSGQLAQHEQTGAKATLALTPVADPTNYGLVRTGKDGAVTEFVEKPSYDQIDTRNISAGAYVLERSVLDLLEPEQPASIERDVFPQLVGSGLFGCVSENYWLDIGTPERYLEATFDILEGTVGTAFAERAGDGYLVVEQSVESEGRIIPSALVEHGCLIADGARVGGRVVLESGVVGGGEHDDRALGRHARRGDRRQLPVERLHRQRRRADRGQHPRDRAVGAGRRRDDRRRQRDRQRGEDLPGRRAPGRRHQILMAAARPRGGGRRGLHGPGRGHPRPAGPSRGRAVARRGGVVVAGGHAGRDDRGGHGRLGRGRRAGAGGAVAVADAAAGGRARAGAAGLDGPETLVLCSSYSGNTEETLAAYDAAGAAGAPRVVCSSGGELPARARKDGVPVIPLPGGFQPRAAVGYSFVVALEVAAVAGCAPSSRAEVEAAVPFARGLAEEWGPDGDGESEAKRLAGVLHETVPVIAGAGVGAAAAYRWKCQLNHRRNARRWRRSTRSRRAALATSWSRARGPRRSATPCSIHPSPWRPGCWTTTPTATRRSRVPSSTANPPGVSPATGSWTTSRCTG